MRRARPALSLPLAMAAAGLLLAACGGDPIPSAAPSPGTSAGPSASPVVESGLDFCTALDVLESEHQILREIRLSPGNRRALNEQMDQVSIAWDDVPGNAPNGLDVQLDIMRWAVINLAIAIEDYATTPTDRFEEAAEHVLREDVAFDKAIARLRARTTCGVWVPTPPPSGLGSPSPSPSGGPAGSPPAGSPPAGSPAAGASPAADPSSRPSAGPSAGPSSGPAASGSPTP